MDGAAFDRLIKALTSSSGRRNAVKASLAGALVAVSGVSQDASAKKKGKGKKGKPKKKKKVQRCLQQTESCNASGQCCGAELGVVACLAQPANKGNCAATFRGSRCCGLDGVLCNPDKDGNCGCCNDKVCTLAGDGQFRCQAPE